MEKPYLIKGSEHTDQRGQICFNNDFDLSPVKRLYTIENLSMETIRGWQGHKIERRWFAAVHGTFKIDLVAIDNWENPSKTCKLFSFEVMAASLDVLYVPKGYVSKIQSLELGSKLLAMADYLLGEVKDEYRFDNNYFNT